MPDKHALLGPSGADKWLHCPPSAKKELEYPDEGSPYAAEGTKAHSLAETKLNSYLQKAPMPVGDDREMERCTNDYKDYVVEVLNEERKRDKYTDLYVEVQLDLSKWVPDSFGTSDAVVVSSNCLHVIDFKYGANVAVDASYNPQLMLYAAGAMEKFYALYGFKDIKMHIFQPRMDSISTDTTTVGELNDWLELSVKRLAKDAYEGHGELNCGTWCKFCRAKYDCLERAEHMTSLADMRKNTTLSTAHIADLLPELKEIKSWCSDLEEFALNQALQGTVFPGFKLVEGRSVRKISDQNEALRKLYKEGFKPVEVAEWKIKTLTELEKLAGKKELPRILGEILIKPEGKPTLVPESDKRPPLKEKKAEALVEAAFNERAAEAD